MDTSITPGVSATPPQKPSHRKHTALVYGSIFLVVAGLLAAAYFVGQTMKSRTAVSPQATDTTQLPLQAGARAWQKPASSQKGFPLVDVNDQNGVLKIYSLSKKQTMTYDKQKVSGGSAGAGLGDSSPIASPNLFYTAFIGADGNLWLLSNETLEAKQLTKNGNVTYITDWSPDSTKLVYYYQRDTLAQRQNGPGPIPTTSDFKPQTELGFYQINIDNGTVTPLAAIEYAEMFIDNDRLLIKKTESDAELATFNTKTLQADQGIIKGNFGFGTGQYDFASDGSKWTYTTSKNPANDSRVVVGSFPQAATTEIEVGAWADYQSPQFSPDNSKVAYWKKEGQVGPGIPNYTVWVYDTTTRKKEKYGTGQLSMWIDDNTILVRKIKNDGLFAGFSLLNLNSKQLTDI